MKQACPRISCGKFELRFIWKGVSQSVMQILATRLLVYLKIASSSFPAVPVLKCLSQCSKFLHLFYFKNELKKDMVVCCLDFDILTDSYYAKSETSLAKTHQ